MLEYQKKKLMEKYHDYSLKVEPFILSAAGYNRHETTIKVGEYTLFCAPIVISLDKCKLLLSLSPREHEEIEKQKNSLVSVKFSFSPAFFDKPVSFYIRAVLTDIISPRENVYIFEITLDSTPDSFKKIFLFMADLLAKYNELYESNPEIKQDKCITPKTFNFASIYKGDKLASSGEVAFISPQIIKIKNPKNILSIDLNDSVNIETIFYNKKIKLTGKITQKAEDIHDFLIDYKTDFIYILSKFLN